MRITNNECRTRKLRKAAMERGMRILRQDGWEKVSLKVTSTKKFLRITSTFQISYDLDELEGECSKTAR